MRTQKLRPPFPSFISALILLAGSLISSCQLYAQSLIDIDFGGANSGTEVGFAVTGQTTNDFWNFCSGGTVNLEYVDGTSSGASVTVANIFGNWGTGAADPMYDSYLYTSGRDILVTLTNVSAGTYDFYIYGHGAADNQNSTYVLSVGGQSIGSLTTLNGPGWDSSAVWQLGLQYVEFSNVVVTANQIVTITVAPAASGFAVIAGMQIAPVTGPPGFIAQPTSQTAFVGANVSFGVGAYGTPPLSYQWQFNGTNLLGATTSSLALTDVQLSQSGDYSVVVTNALGSVTSSNALLGVSVLIAQYLYTGSETNITLNPGLYAITAYGAQGGSATNNEKGGIGGLGAEMEGVFNFTTATTLTILVGGGGGGGAISAGAGGGGGSFVSVGTTPLVVAGGGGGGGAQALSTNYGGGFDVNGFPGGNAATGANGSGNGGSGGGGNPQYSDDVGGGGGGGGYNGGGTNGAPNPYYYPGGGGDGGTNYLTGGLGGHGYYSGGGWGGYGGGGGGGDGGGGGGGGYSGGNGGDGGYNYGPSGGGGGGGSFIASSALTALAEVSGAASPDGSPNGEIIIAAPSQSVTLNYRVIGGQLVLYWAQGTLLSAGTVSGTYNPVSGAGSPYTNSMTGVSQYFRVLVY